MVYWQTIAELAAELGAKPEAIRKWRQRGVPGIWHLRLLEQAEKAGKTLPREALQRDRGAPSDQPEAAA